MLILALAATLIGFVLLVVGLVTGTVWLAVACIVVCLVGLIFLIADIVRSSRRGDDAPADSGGGFGFGPADHESDVDETTGGADGATEPDAGEDVRVSPEQERQALWQGVVEPRSGPNPQVDPASTGTPQAPGGAAPRAGQPTAPGPQNSPVPQNSPGPRSPQPPNTGGGYADYLRSVGADDVPRTGQHSVPGPQQGSPHPGAPRPGMPPTPGAQQPMPSRPHTGPVRNGPAQTGPAQNGPGNAGQDARPSAPEQPQQQPPRKIDPLDPEWRPPSE
ncbi:hypothetical protein [Gordonia sp. NPDC003376]